MLKGDGKIKASPKKGNYEKKLFKINEKWKVRGEKNYISFKKKKSLKNGIPTLIDF